MTHRRRLSFLLPLLALTALSLLPMPSLFTPGQVPSIANDALHFWVRLHEFTWLFDRGVVWPRWGPNLSYGYGYPVFHYYGSLSLYPLLVLDKLGLSMVGAMQAGFWLTFLFGGWAAFGWLWQATGDQRSAAVGAAAYMFVPYRISTTLYRLNIPEQWAMVLPPLVLWGMTRIAAEGSRRNWRSVAWTALAVAALPLTSNLATLVFAPVFLSYGLLLLAQAQDRRALVRRLAVCAALAVGLATFFWLPAVWDRGAVQIDRGYRPGGLNVFHNFLPLERVFSQPLAADVSRVTPQYRLTSLSPVLIVLALALTVVFWRRMDRRQRWLGGWAIAGVMVCAWLSIRASVSLYRVIAFLQVIQFPWRFLAPATLLVAGLVAVAVSAAMGALDRAAASRWLVLGLLGLVLLSWPALYPGLYSDIPANPTLAQAVSAEVGISGSIGTYAEYLPGSVQEIPESSPMYADYLSGNPVLRWDRARLPAGARTLALQDEGLVARWEVDTPQAFDALYQVFYFPGWRATVDGQRVPIQVADPHGLIEVPVPAGQHTVEVRFGPTPERLAATAISLLALVFVLYLLVRPGDALQPSLAIADRAPGAWLALGAIGVLLLLIRVGLVDRLDWWPRVRLFDGQTVRGLSNSVEVTWSRGERLLGYELLALPGSRGDDLDLELYWATDGGQDFRALVRLVDERGVAWSEWSELVEFPGLLASPPASDWGTHRYASIPYRVDVPPGTPPGVYGVSVTVLDPESRQPAQVVQGQALTAERTDAVVGQVEVARQRVRRNGLGAYTDDVPLPVAEGIWLLGHEATHSRAMVGERIKLYPLWWAERTPDAEALTLRLVDAAGESAPSWTFPLGTRLPSSEWEGRELIRDQYDLLVPPELASGQYVWVAQIEPESRTFGLGTLEVYAPEREYEVPPDIVEVGQILDETVRLVGYVAGPLEPGQPFPVTLYWQALETMQTDYKVFVQLLSESGVLVAQSDAIPAQWTRLTTGWLPPEVVVDAHTLWPPADLPAGVYRLVVGLYEPKTGRRALTPQGADVILLLELTLSGS